MDLQGRDFSDSRDPVIISPIPRTRFSIRIGALKRQTKPWTYCFLQHLEIKQIHQEIRLFLQLI